VADAPRRSRSFVLASLRALHLDLRLVAGDRAAVEEGGVQVRQLASRRGWGAISSPHRTCPIRVGPLEAAEVGPLQAAITNPAIKGDRQQLDWLRKLAEIGPPWRCGEWLSYAHWYDLRSSVAHGDDEPVTAEEASQAEYWIFMWTVEPLLQWLVEHPGNPLGELDQALAALERVPDWQNPVPNPATYEPGNHPAS
jgi:hypothetical protein